MTKWTARLTLISGFLILFVGGGARFAIGLTLRPMVDGLGWDRANVGAAVAAFQVVSALCTFIAGRYADRMSMRIVIGVGLFLSAIGIGGMSLVVQPWQALLLYGGLFAIGNGMTSTSPVGVMVTRAFPKRAGGANGFATSGLSVGQLVVISTLAAVLAAVGWRWSFAALGIAIAALTPILIWAVPSHPRPVLGAPRDDGRSLREAAHTRQFWLLLVIYAICGFSDFFVATHIVALAQDRGMSELLAGNLLALMGLTGLIGVLAAGAWSDRTGPAPSTFWSFVVRILAFAFIYADQSPVAVAVFALTFGATFLITAPMTVLFVRETYGVRNLGAITGLVTMVHQTFGGLGAFLGAWIYDSTGNYDAGFALLFCLSGVAAILSLLLDRPAAPEAAAQAAPAGAPARETLGASLLRTCLCCPPLSLTRPKASRPVAQSQVGAKAGET